MIVVPHWAQSLKRDNRADRCVLNKFFIKTGALLHNPQGSIEQFATALGVTGVSLYYTGHDKEKRGQISADLALKIQQVLGEDVMPARLLRPDLF